MNQQIKLIILWFILILGMVLHFNYHVGDIFYGIDVTVPNANGSVPFSTFIIRTLFYHLPIAWILIIMYTEAPKVKLTLFLISVLYTISHLAHLLREAGSEEIDPSQISLLVIVLGVSGLLTFSHYKYWKQKDSEFAVL